MNIRAIKVYIQREPERYEELMSAMLEHREYNGCYVMLYSEYEENGWKIGEFMLRDAD